MKGEKNNTSTITNNEEIARLNVQWIQKDILTNDSQPNYYTYYNEIDYGAQVTLLQSVSLLNFESLLNQ